MTQAYGRLAHMGQRELPRSYWAEGANPSIFGRGGRLGHMGHWELTLAYIGEGAAPGIVEREEFLCSRVTGEQLLYTVYLKGKLYSKGDH